jgi:glutamate-1-semialdehyde 2,1-aminomutase
VAVAAGLAALNLVDREDPYARMEATATALVDGMASTLSEAGVDHRINRCGSLFSLFFGSAPIRDFATARSADHAAYARFFHGMLDRGVSLPPSGYEAWFMGAAHGEREVERTLDALRRWVRADA